MYSFLPKLLLLLSATVFKTVIAQGCGGGFQCGTLYPIDPVNNVDCVYDPNTPDYLEAEFLVCACTPGAVASASLIYIVNTPGAYYTTVPALNSVSVGTSVIQYVTLSFDAPYTKMEPPVTIAEILTDGTTTATRSATFTLLPEQTVFYTSGTTTITSTDYSTATTTITQTEVDVTISPGPIVTSTCTSGTDTITTKPVTSTITTTSTPPSRTVTKTVLTTSTTTLTCVPTTSSPPQKARVRRRMEADLQRRQGGPTYALPACVGTPVSLTTITTSTVVTSTTTTATVTNTAYSTTTLQTTSTAPPQTICNHASTTITSTPTTTKTKTVHGATGIITTSTTVGVTKTVVPKGLGPC